jgi:GNAT superfamily N-acetyltransferase
MIRKAVESDMPEMLRMGRKFVDQAWAGIFEWDEQGARNTLEMLMTAGILLVADTGKGLAGMVGAVVTPLFLNPKETVAQELFWWAEARGFGLGLMQALEDEAAARGVTLMSNNLLHRMRPDDVARVYERRGYVLVESTYLKRLN